jgi:hypothetical protein
LLSSAICSRTLHFLFLPKSEKMFFTHIKQQVNYTIYSFCDD